MTNHEKLQRRLHKYLSIRPRTEKEVSGYLSRLTRNPHFAWVTDEIIAETVEKLKARSIIDDPQFVRWWIADRSKLKPRSLSLMKYELKQKGISQEDVEKNVDVPEDLDAATLSVLIEKRITKPEWTENRHKKLYAYLLRRGYRYAQIRNAIEDREQKR